MIKDEKKEVRMESQKSKAPKKMYTREEIEEARQKMLEHLASLSDGALILGCCTQGCCDEKAQKFSVSL